jgi:regulator of sirC expression with transglutaminase-like and TPR domain
MFALTCAAALVLAVAVGVRADDAPGDKSPAQADEQQIARLIGQLDAEDFSTRQLAHEQLVEIGYPALPQLLAAAKSDSAEKRYRAGAIVEQVKRRSLEQGFRRLAKVPDEQIDLDEGMCLISQILEPSLDRRRIDERLDELAARVRKRLGEGVAPRAAPPREAVEALLHVLFVEEGFAGNRGDYDNPHNSSLAYVLEQKKGLPILLSHLVVSVGSRLDLPLVGLQMPSRYMLKYEGSRAPPDQPRDDIVIDAYGEGKILSLDEIKQLVPTFDPAVHLAPSGRLAALTRMLRNLHGDLLQAGRLDEARQVAQYLAICDAQ